MLGWTTSRVEAQGGTAAVHACAAIDGALRLSGSASCPDGQRSLYLALSSTATPPAPASDATAQAGQGGAADRELADLDARVARLERAAGNGELAARVVAPFEVVDRQGKLIFSVREGSVAVFNGSGKKVAEILPTDAGATINVYSVTTDLKAVMGAGTKSVGVSIIQGSERRIDLGRDANQGNYRMRFFSETGKDVAAIGEGAAGGAGVAAIADRDGNIRARMYVSSDNHRPVFRIDSSSTQIAVLTEGANREGLLQLFNSAGERMVEAGGTAEGVGVVRAGPESFKPGYGVLGLPGSYLSGKP
jgi:hypothetical protein